MTLMEHSPQDTQPMLEPIDAYLSDGQEFTDNQDFEIEACKRKLYDLFSAEADGITVSLEEKEHAKKELRFIIATQAQEVFDLSACHLTQLEALGSAGIFIDRQVGSLSAAILDLYGGEVPEDLKHRPMGEIMVDRYKGMLAVYRDEPEKVDSHTLIQDACVNALHLTHREVKAGLTNATNENQTTAVMQEVETVEKTNVFQRIGQLAILRRLGM